MYITPNKDNNELLLKKDFSIDYIMYMQDVTRHGPATDFGGSYIEYIFTYAHFNILPAERLSFLRALVSMHICPY